GVGVQRHHAIAVQIVSEPAIAVPIRRGISRTPEGEVGFGIVRPRIPDGSASGFPRIARPGFVARLARTGDRIEPPGLPAGLRVERDDAAASPPVSTGRADDYLVLYAS